MKVSAIIPAYNEAERLGATLMALQSLEQVDEYIVVDDGSVDGTGYIAFEHGARVIRLNHRHGKGYALRAGASVASGDVLLLLDADLGHSAMYAEALLAPILDNRSDLSIAVLPQVQHKGGFGIVKYTARAGIRALTGREVQEPLSGQRALKKELWQLLSKDPSAWGQEVYLTIEALKRGLRVMEVPVAFSHRLTGRGAKDWAHRGAQLRDVVGALWRQWRRSS